MPIHVTIYVNDHMVRELHIGRTTSNPEDMLPDSVNTYLAILGSEPLRIEGWKQGVEFTHRYGDPIEVCVQKALDALTYKPLSEAETMPATDIKTLANSCSPDVAEYWAKQGEKVAEKRIIKMLNKNLKTAQGLVGYSMNATLTESYLHGLKQSIDIVKGENK
jgi:hypothetical protein